MSTITRTTELKAALPADFSGESKDTVQWMKAMKAYFSINPSIYIDDNNKIMTMLNKMSKGQEGHFADKTFDKLAESFTSTFYPYNIVETTRDDLYALRQKENKDDDGFQDYITKFQNLAAQVQMEDTKEVHVWLATGLDFQLTTMIFSMEEVPEIFQGYIDKVIDFHSQKNYCP